MFIESCEMRVSRTGCVRYRSGYLLPHGGDSRRTR